MFYTKETLLASGFNYWGEVNGKKFIKAIKASSEYKESIASGDFKPITKVEEEIFLSSNGVSFSDFLVEKLTEETQNKLTSQKYFRNICDESTVIYNLWWGVGYSGTNIAIDLGTN